MNTWEKCNCRIHDEICELVYGVGKETYVYETKAHCMEQAIDNLFHDRGFGSNKEIRLIKISFIFPSGEKEGD